jgi:8-oxo-dGTP pyrophosphatase MutT (NUDIX family)
LRNAYRRIARPRIAGVSLLISDDAGRVMLVRHSYGSRQWALPGGGLAHGEEPEVAARRELREELGCEASGMTQIGRLEERISGAPHTAYVFAATLAGEPRPDRREVLQLRFFAEGELPTNLSSLTRSRLALWRAWRLEQR